MEQCWLRGAGVGASRQERSSHQFCQLMPKDDVVGFLAGNNSHKGTRRKSSGTIHCVFFR